MSCRKLLQSIVFTSMLLLSQFAFAQDRVVTGKVTDSTGVGIAAVTVTGRGTRVATQTTTDGSFRITLPASVDALIFSSIGFTTLQVPIPASNTMNVSISGVTSSLNEVVVIGYGTARKKDLTGSVANVTSKDFVKGPITTPEQLIAGKVAGVQVTPNDGAPGSGSRIRIRGGTSLNASNDPLIVIDGVPLDNGGISGTISPLSLINPNDIESMSILKDASAAAIYGNRAANGVILVTTKKGTGGKLKIAFSSLNSISEIKSNVDVFSADQYKNLVNSKGSTSDKALLTNNSTDWQDQIYQSAFATDNNIALSGGIKHLPYRLSLGYLNQDGILKRDNLQRTTASLNLNPKFLDNQLSIDANAKFAHEKYFFANRGAIGSAVYFDPSKPIYSGKNSFGGYWEWLSNDTTLNGLAPKNPVGLLNQREDKSDVNRFIGSVQVDYKMRFVPGLRANLNVGLDKSHGEGTVYVPPYAASDYNRTSLTGARAPGRWDQYEQDKTNQLLEFYLNYAKDLSSIHSRVDATAGYTYQDWKTEIPTFPDLAANKKDTISKADPPGYGRNTLVSFYGRVNYSYKSRYLLTVTYRRDGSSRFSEQNRWGNFPSAAFAWNMKEEDFLKDNSVVSAMKLRLGWGITGQQEGISDFGYQAIYFYGNSAAQYQFGNNYYTVVRPQAYDENLKWEQTESRNIGIDIGFAKNRVNVTADYYDRDTKDLLATVPAPAGTNFSNTITTNIGSTKSSGFEFSVLTTPVRNKTFSLDLGVNLTYIINYKITKLQLVNDPTYLGAEVGSIGINGNIQRNTVGYQPNTFFLWKQIYDKTGKPIEGLYEDKNRDGKIDDYDKYWVHNPEPNVYMGFSGNATYKKFGAGFSARASFNNYVYNNVNAGSAVYTNIFTGQNYLNNGTTDLLASNFTNRQSWSDYYLQNGSFFRMDNAYVSYNFGRIINDQANLRVSFNVQNVFVITKYTGLDPEISGGIDGSIYPRPRIYAVGVNLDF
jgi:TonB-linked SusC/RagA family outer membrane protein